jgi:AcrR family transcriptional regulator
VDLLWTGRPTPGRGPKPGLSLERIVEEAVALADAEGLAAVSMKTLAGRLGAGTMSLYRYLPGKDDLLGLMVDTVIGRPPAELSTLDWRSALRRWAYDSRDLFHRHPWVLGVIGSSRTIGPNELAWAEAALGVLRRAGAPAAAMLDIVFAVNGYVRGTAQLSAYAGQGPTIDLAAVAASGRLGEYPAFAELAASPDLDPAYDHRTDATFAFGLDLLLDGVGRLIP